MKFTISKIICDCGSRLFWSQKEIETGEWIQVYCSNCEKEENYYIDFVFGIGYKNGPRTIKNSN
jgi:hypothetical protein